jgi:hypothetical protein
VTETPYNDQTVKVITDTLVELGATSTSHDTDTIATTIAARLAQAPAPSAPGARSTSDQIEQQDPETGAWSDETAAETAAADATGTPAGPAVVEPDAAG